MVAAGRARVRARPRQIESAIQAAIGIYLGFMEKQGRLVAWPVPNGIYVQGSGEERAKRVRILKQRFQIRPGVSDIGVLLRGGIFGVLEVKSNDGDTTKEQDDFIALVRAMGGKAAVVRSVDEVRSAILAWEQDHG